MKASPPTEAPSRWRAGARHLRSSATTRVAGRPRLRKNAVRALKSLGGAIGYAAFVEPYWISLTHVDVPVPGLSPELDGYRIVHLTDIHHNLVSGPAFLESVVRTANSLDGDLVALTGDFVTHNPRRMPQCFRILSGLRAPDGIFATRGNHDYGLPLDRMSRIARRAGVRLLENEHETVSASRHRIAGGGDARIVVAGVGDLWEGHPNPSLALMGAPSDGVRVLLSHNPQVAEIVAPWHRVAIQLSGHTHGGQVRPFHRPLRMLSDGTAKYASGLVEAPATRVYVSRGVGTSALRLRWNCRPEIALVVLRSVPGEP